MNVGFIGLGNMGAAMAGRLLQAGHKLTVYNRTPSKAQGLIDRGAHLAAGVAAAHQAKDLRDRKKPIGIEIVNLFSKWEARHEKL